MNVQIIPSAFGITSCLSKLNQLQVFFWFVQPRRVNQ